MTMMKNKYDQLIEYFKELGSVAVAFSSGVDSTFLLYAAHEALGDRALAVTLHSGVFPEREFDDAKAFTSSLGIKHVTVDVDQLQIEGFVQNPADRCYICKKYLFSKIFEVAKENGVNYVVEGSNKDDEGDYRPGLQAVKELGAKSPLRELGFTKAEIRAFSKEHGLPTAVKPSFACLASRVPYGETITAKKLEMIDKGEQLLLDKGFSQFRVRIHGENVARIELLPEEMSRMADDELRTEIYDKFKEFGFAYVAIDLKGYRTGSMNETLNL